MTDWWNRKAAKQLLAFDGLSYSNGIRPSDVDAIIEYKDKGYILFEAKYDIKEVPRGQKLMLERMVNDFDKTGKEAMAMVCEHYVKDEDTDVILGDSLLREFYWKGSWRVTDRPMTVKEATDQLIRRWENRKDE